MSLLISRCSRGVCCPKVFKEFVDLKVFKEFVDLKMLKEFVDLKVFN